MTGSSLRKLWEAAERDPRFHKELAILEFTEELSRVMRAAGVTRTELGRRIGSSQAYISRVLNGGANFTLGSMTKLALGLGVELRVHLAPADTVTTWHDHHLVPGGTGGMGRLIEADFVQGPGHVARYAAAAATPRGTAALPDAEVRRGAATTAA